jgi:predicted RNA binding protein YcfA (HicA-like mRNA interferase family)
MSKADKILQQVLRGTSDKNIAFADLCYLLDRLGFEKRIKGDHHIYTREGIQEIINIQPKGTRSKVYQVKQVRTIILKYKLEV